MNSDINWTETRTPNLARVMNSRQSSIRLISVRKVKGQGHTGRKWLGAAFGYT